MHLNVRAAVGRALNLLTPRDRRLLGVSVVVQMCTSLLDLIGVLLIGLVGALSVTTVQSQPPPAAASSIADALGLPDASSQNLVMIFAGAAAIVLLTKSLVSTYLNKRVLVFLANRQALVSARLAKELLSRPLLFVQLRSSQETAFSLISGANAATIQLLGCAVAAATELALLVVLGVALLFVSPWMAIGAIAFFALIAFGLQRALGDWASRVGALAASMDIGSLGQVQEAIGTYREITVTGRRALYVSRIQSMRWQAAKALADLQFIGLLPKYLFEVALVLGAFALAAVLFATQDSVAAVGTLALFLAAGSRVMPSLLRLQGAALGLRAAAGSAGPTFSLADDLGNPLNDPDMLVDPERLRADIRRGSSAFTPSIVVDGVSMVFPEADSPALEGVSFEVQAGQSVALVGPSGAGKSTLADIVLGIVEPTSGRVTLGGQAPGKSLTEWPNAVGYVPQDVFLANDTVRSNVALGLPPQAIDDELVWEALDRAHLATFLHDTRDGLDTVIGEQGVRLSGGQRQRLGIARALYARPRLLVLDEATSALDAETEQSVARTIAELEGKVTTLIIAHRLSTVRSVDLLVYLESGRVAAMGRFEEVLERVPAFARQSRLMGLGQVG